MENRILSINLGNFGSTGTIMSGIMCEAEECGFETVIAYPGHKNNKKKQKNDIIITSEFWKKVSEKLSYYTGFNGCFSVFSTIRFLSRVRKYNPNIIHLHNLHNSYINLSLLFIYIKLHEIKLVWTLHDCWSFTGQCPHFTMVKCDKWKTGCHRCPSYHEYPGSCVDRTKTMWKLKKKWFTGVEDLTIVTPSQWLAGLVGESYLKDYPVKVIHNGIDLTVFQPTASNFREKHHIPKNKKYCLVLHSAGESVKDWTFFCTLKTII